MKKKISKVFIMTLAAIMLISAMLTGMTVQAAEGDEVTVYFADVLNYGTPYFEVEYSASSGKEDFTESMLLAGKNAQGQKIYKYTFDPEGVERFQFDYISGDYYTEWLLSIAGNTVYYFDEVVEQIEYQTKYSCGSYAYDEDTIATPVQNITVYFTDNKNWGEAWISLITHIKGESTTYKMEPVGNDSDGYPVYSYTFDPVGIVSITFSDSDDENKMKQFFDTTDYLFDDKSGYYCDEISFDYYDETTGDLVYAGWLIGTYTYTGLDVSTTGGTGGDSGNEITIYFTNNRLWDGVWIMTVGGDGQPVIVPMTLVGTDADGLEVYSCEVDPSMWQQFYFTNSSEPNTTTEVVSILDDNTALLVDTAGFYAGTKILSTTPTSYAVQTYTFTSLDVSTTGEGSGNGITVYFTNNKLWDGVWIMTVGGDDQPVIVPMTLVGADADGLEVYSYTVDFATLNGLYFVNDSELSTVTEAVAITSAAMVGDKVGFYAGVLATEGNTKTYFPATYIFTDLTASTTAQVGDTTVYFADVLDWSSAILVVVSPDNVAYMLEMKVLGTDANGKTIYKGVFNSENAVSIEFASDVSRSKYTVEIEDFSNGAGYYCTTVDSNEAYNVETFTYSAFEDVNIALGENITVKYYTLNGYTDPQMRFTINGYTKTVDGILVDGNQYKFVFDGVAPQWIGDTITAELIVGGEVIEIKEYSVLRYLNTLKAKSAAELGISEAKYSRMQTLIADLLVYGGAAQNYTGHNTGALVSEGITGSTCTSLNSADLSKTDGAYVTFTGATVFFSSTNRLKFKFEAKDLSGVSFKVKINGGDEADISYVDNGDGSYTLITDAIYADHFDDVYTVIAYKNGAVDATLTYSVKSYVYAKQDGTEKIAALVKATYNYGISAKAYKNAQ